MAADMPSKEEVEALREMAANRGCRLVRSRRRKPGGDFGRFGLADAKTGREVFGFGKSGLKASAGEIETFLRGSSASTWKKSLGAAGKAAKPTAPPRKRAAGGKPNQPRAAAVPAPSRLARSEPEPAAPKPVKAKPVEPSEPPALRVRRADAVDGEVLAALLTELGEKVTAESLDDRIARFSRTGEPVLLARLGEEVVGCATGHIMPILARPDPVGRITLLVVAARARRRGVGTELLRAAERKLAERGCRRVEIETAGKSAAARKFCRALGYKPGGDLFERAVRT